MNVSILLDNRLTLLIVIEFCTLLKSKKNIRFSKMDTRILLSEKNTKIKDVKTKHNFISK